MPRHIEVVIALKGGNEYREGRGPRAKHESFSAVGQSGLEAVNKLDLIESDNESDSEGSDTSSEEGDGFRVWFDRQLEIEGLSKGASDDEQWLDSE